MTLQGIDVSNVNGEPFPWHNWAGKIQFAAVKISEGTNFADPDAATNIAGARAIGCQVIGYHFLHNGLGGQGGAPQAEWFLKCAHAAGLRPGDLIAQDVEDWGLGIDLAKATAADVAQAYLHFDLVAAGFSNRIRDYHFPGYNPVLYTEISAAPYLKSNGASPLWLADPSGTPVSEIGPWKLVSFLQNGQRGVDTDVFYGDLSQLKALAFHG